MTKAILFDLGNVLVGFDFKRGYSNIESCCRLQASQIPEVIGGSGLVPLFERGQVSGEEFFQKISLLLGLTVSYERFCGLWSAIFLPSPLVSESLLSGLRQRYRMVLVSNTNEIHFQMIRQNYALLEHFDSYVLSYQVGAMKPAEQMFAEAVRQADCRPEECFYTDDVLEFVEGGRRYGLDAVQFRGATELEQELTRRGIQWNELS